jgi:hypothetical protein
LIEDINMGELHGPFFWGFLLVFGAMTHLPVRRSKDEARFFLPRALPRYRMASGGRAA